MAGAEHRSNQRASLFYVWQGHKPKRTTVKKKTLNPVWDEMFSFEVVTIDTTLIFDVLDHNFIGSDDYLGQVALG